MKFVDLFAGLGGFHKALDTLGHECVFACEIDPELRLIYKENFPKASKTIYGDIRDCKDRVPAHEILCAGFPCQPFSKSGTQKGLKDKTRGTLFHEILHVLDHRRPEYVILENVGNFERHDEGRTWKIVRESLEKLGYDVRGTEHVATGGTGLLSPHHFGFPHSRERFYIVARQGKLQRESLPKGDRSCATNLEDIVQAKGQLRPIDRIETVLTLQQRKCIDHWNALLSKLPEGRVELPSFPIWGDEFEATYPFEKHSPFKAPIAELRRAVNGHTALSRVPREELLELLPSYARHDVEQFPRWKVDFIRKNREWFEEHRKYFGIRWLRKLREFPPSLRKLEWNCQGEERDLWQHVLQFRPSGLRVKRYSACPSLVAMTSTQIPLLGPERRFLTRVEGLRLQGFPDTHKIPESRSKTFHALGNAVHVGVVGAIANKLFQSK